MCMCFTQQAAMKKNTSPGPGCAKRSGSRKVCVHGDATNHYPHPASKSGPEPPGTASRALPSLHPHLSAERPLLYLHRTGPSPFSARTLNTGSQLLQSPLLLPALFIPPWQTPIHLQHFGAFSPCPGAHSGPGCWTESRVAASAVIPQFVEGRAVAMCSFFPSALH